VSDEKNSPELIAILRGITPAQVDDIGRVLMGAGFKAIEVPLNSPEPFVSIGKLVRAFGDRALIGAGTVTTPADVERVHEAGGKLVVAPNCDAQVIGRALELNLRVLPGIATPTEAFAALAAGARDLKLFPAATYGAKHLQALKSVLPAHARVYPVGGIGALDIAPWLAAKADGFGFGGELFTPAYTLEQVQTRARDLFAAVKRAMASRV
jgi:2-dehydro-3-deoxyphosphogalactonate aldolase